jgi:drug/metabolite transporter (DMT)-like permease
MSPGRASILVYTMPIWASLFARPMLGEQLSRNRIVALLLGAAAVVVMVSQDLSNLRNAPLGAALTLVAALSFGLGTVWLKRRPWRSDASVVAFWQLAIGVVPLLAVWAIVSAPPDLSHAGPAQWLSLLFLGIVANGAAYFAWFRLVRRLPAGVSGISSLAVPCIGVASSAWLAGERLHAQDLAAMALIAAALLAVLAERALSARSKETRLPGAGG